MNTKGAALLLVLLITVLLSVLVVEFAFLGRTDSRVAEHRLNDRKARWLAEGGCAAAGSILLADSPLVDSLNDIWAAEFPPIPEAGGHVSFRIMDEDGKINVNMLLEDDGAPGVLYGVFERLLEEAAVGRETAEALLDELRLREGAGFAAASELLEIEGIEDIMDYVTVYTDGKININTASEKVVMALSAEITPPAAAEIVNYREASPFGSVSQLARVPGVSEDALREISSIVKIQSEVFRIESSFALDAAVKNMITVLRRRRDGFAVLYRRS